MKPSGARISSLRRKAMRWFHGGPLTKTSLTRNFGCRCASRVSQALNSRFPTPCAAKEWRPGKVNRKSSAKGAIALSTSPRSMLEKLRRTRVRTAVRIIGPYLHWQSCWCPGTYKYLYTKQHPSWNVEVPIAGQASGKTDPRSEEAGDAAAVAGGCCWGFRRARLPPGDGRRDRGGGRLHQRCCLLELCQQGGDLAVLAGGPRPLLVHSDRRRLLRRGRCPDQAPQRR